MDIMGVSVTRGDESKVSKISNVSYASTEIIRVFGGVASKGNLARN